MIELYAIHYSFANISNYYRKRRYKRPGRLLGTLLDEGGGWAFIKAIFLMNQF